MLTSILRNTKVTTGFESQRAMSESMRPFSQLSASDLVHAVMTLLLEEDDLCGDSPSAKNAHDMIERQSGTRFGGVFCKILP